MSIFSRAKAHSAYLSAASIVAAFTLPVIALTAAYADTLIVGGCVGAPGAINCVARVGTAGDPYIRTVPQPETEADKERAAAHPAKQGHRAGGMVRSRTSRFSISAFN